MIDLNDKQTLSTLTMALRQSRQEIIAIYAKLLLAKG